VRTGKSDNSRGFARWLISPKFNLNGEVSMSIRTLTCIAAALVIGTGLGLPAAAQGDAYTAIAQTRSDTGDAQTQFKFNITKWSTQDDIKRLGVIFKNQGQNALLEELKKLDSGRIGTLKDTGNPIAVAEKWQDGADTVITVISARRIGFGEARSRQLTTDYPFAFLQVRLNANGEGSGKMVTAAKIKYDQAKGTYRLDPYGNGSTPVTNVRPMK
jgi:hypothetical protein